MKGRMVDEITRTISINKAMGVQMELTTLPTNDTLEGNWRHNQRYFGVTVDSMTKNAWLE
jgi:hypothetical protein